MQFVGLARWAGHALRLHHALRLNRVIAQKIHRFAHLGQRIAPGFMGLFDEQGAKARRFMLQSICRLAEDGRTLLHGKFAPFLIALYAVFIWARGQFGIKKGNCSQLA